jgi:hypothetical protein
LLLVAGCSSASDATTSSTSTYAIGTITAEEKTQLEFVSLVQTLLTDQGVDDWARWVADWEEQSGDVTSGSTVLLLKGLDFCEQTSSAYTAGETPINVARNLVYQVQDGSGFEDLNMASSVAAVRTLCPEFGSYLSEGLDALG